jgi:hypothetical protein
MTRREGYGLDYLPYPWRLAPWLILVEPKRTSLRSLSVSGRAVGFPEPGLDQRLRVGAVAPTEGAGDSYASLAMPIARSPSESTLGSLVTDSDRGRKRLLCWTLDLGIFQPKVPQKNHTISR